MYMCECIYIYAHTHIKKKILKSSKFFTIEMLHYRGQPRLSCWVIFIFLIVVLNSVTIYDYSKKL